MASLASVSSTATTFSEMKSDSRKKSDISQREKKIRALRQEIDKLKEKVDKEKKKVAPVAAESFAVSSRFRMKEKFSLLPEEACYVLCIETDTPLDCVACNADTQISLLDSGQSVACVSSAPVSVYPSIADDQDDQTFLATFRMQDAVTRLEVKVVFFVVCLMSQAACC